jgi:hypothetical protein
MQSGTTRLEEEIALDAAYHVRKKVPATLSASRWLFWI